MICRKEFTSAEAGLRKSRRQHHTCGASGKTRCTHWMREEARFRGARLTLQPHHDRNNLTLNDDWGSHASLKKKKSGSGSFWAGSQRQWRQGGHAFAAADAKCLPFINDWLRRYQHGGPLNMARFFGLDFINASADAYTKIHD